MSPPSTIFAEELDDVFAFGFGTHYLYEREAMPGEHERLGAHGDVGDGLAVTAPGVAEFDELIRWLRQIFHLRQDRILSDYVYDYYFGHSLLRTRTFECSNVYT